MEHIKKIKGKDKVAMIYIDPESYLPQIFTGDIVEVMTSNYFQELKDREKNDYIFKSYEGESIYCIGRKQFVKKFGKLTVESTNEAFRAVEEFKNNYEKWCKGEIYGVEIADIVVCSQGEQHFINSRWYWGLLGKEQVIDLLSTEPGFEDLNVNL